jgi:parvulin-like peptidyl-prolyl isomerase
MYRILVVILSLIICVETSGESRSVKDLFEAPPQTTDASARTKSDRTATTSEKIAEVNGRKIDADEFYRVLYASAGSRVLRQFIGLELARQMARGQGVEPTQSDFDMEFHNVVNELSPEKDAIGKALTFEDKTRILNAILARRGLSREEFEVGLKRQVYLKAVVKKKIVISDSMLRDEFARTYGNRRRIRGIVVADGKLASDIYNKLQKGEDFAGLAGKYSIDFVSAPIGGQMGEVAKDDPKVASIVSETVFKLEIGAYSSPIRVNDQYWIVKVERESAPQPISFEEVKAQLRTQLYRRQETEMIKNLEAELFKEAKISVYNKVLSQDFNQWLKQINASEK